MDIVRKQVHFDEEKCETFIGDKIMIVVENRYDKVFINDMTKDGGFVEMITQLKSSASNKGKDFQQHIQVTPYDTEIKYDVLINDNKMCYRGNNIRFLEKANFCLKTVSYSKLPIIPIITRLCTNDHITIVQVEPSKYELGYRTAEIFVIYEKDDRVEHHTITKKDVMRDGGTTYIETIYDSVVHSVYFPQKMFNGVMKKPSYDGVELYDVKLDTMFDNDKEKLLTRLGY